MRSGAHLDTVLKIGVVVLTLLTAALCFLNLQVDKTLKSTREEMVQSILKRYEMGLVAARNMLVDNAGRPFLDRIKNDPSLRMKLTKELVYFRTPEIEHLFVLTKDAEGRYRFLLDAENNESQRALFLQRFEPLSSIWDDVYSTKSSQYYRHMEDGKLWVSVAIPILENGKVVAVAGEDLSAQIKMDVEKKFSHIKRFVTGIIVIMGVLLLFAYSQIFFYFRRRKSSLIDPLTGAYNRQFFYEVAAKWNYTDYMIILFDIDHFKHVNDKYGHDAGDKVLQAIKKRVERQLRQSDYLIRFGGEEFLVFFHAENEEDVKSVAERIRLSISSSPFIIGEKKLDISISLGINTDLKKVSNIDEAIELADEYLYCAKRKGRNRVCCNGSVI